MPPLVNSRYQFCSALKDADGNLYLTERTPYRFKAFNDNRFHTVIQGETLHSLAEQFFPSIADSANLWWVIADFQPTPIHDPTIELAPGRQMVIPSERVVQEEIFNPANHD
jgi:hypothetical protein